MTIVLIDSIAIPTHKHETRRVKVSSNPRGKWSQRRCASKASSASFSSLASISHARRAGFSACIPSSLSSPFVTGRVDQDRRTSGHRCLSLVPREFAIRGMRTNITPFSLSSPLKCIFISPDGLFLHC